MLSKRLAERGKNRLIERSAITVAQYAGHWLVTIAPARASGKTRERYGELIEKHIIPNVGDVELQKLDGPQIDSFYATLSKSGRRDGNGGLSPQTVRHIHRLLSLILASAVKAKKLDRLTYGSGANDAEGSPGPKSRCWTMRSWRSCSGT